jgi:hypothetical protein
VSEFVAGFVVGVGADIHGSYVFVFLVHDYIGLVD